MTIDDMRKWADRCETQGKPVLAMLIRQQIWKREQNEKKGEPVEPRS